jgi:hypothetical protein
LRFDGVRSVVRSNDGARVTLLDGSEVVLSASRADKRVNSGMYVDDARYGRVLVSWDAFDRVDFTPAASVPAYDDFSPGRPLNATVVTGSGRRLAGRLVYDLDESETTETLDAPWEGVDYTIPFGLISEVELGQGDEQAARVTLLSGEQLQLERWGDLAESNIGVFIFSEARTDPDFVPWADIERIRFDRPPEI